RLKILMAMYLNVHSQYSLRYGTMSIPTLVEEAAAQGVTQMAITDINCSTGVMEFMRECDEAGIKPVGGIEFRRDEQLLYVGIARNREGMRELNEFLSEHNLAKQALPNLPPAFEHACIIYPLGVEVELRTNEYIGIHFDQLHLLYKQDITSIKEKL